MNVPSPLLDRLAQLLVLYEHLRIEAFAVTELGRGVDRSSMLSIRGIAYRQSIHRFAVALLDFDCALSLLSQMDEYKSAETNPENSQEIKTLMAMVSTASRHLDAHHGLLRFPSEHRG